MSRFDYQGKVTTNVNRQGKKKKRTLDRPKETPAVGQPRKLVPDSAGRAPGRKPILPNPGQAPVKQATKAAPPSASSKARPTAPKPKARPTSSPSIPSSSGPGTSPVRAAATTTTTGGAYRSRSGGMETSSPRRPNVSVSVSNETAIGRGINSISISNATAIGRGLNRLTGGRFEEKKKKK